MVLNKPYGLAVQGGSGTYRHIDGMLDAFADEQGRAAAPGPSARSRYLRRAAGRQDPQDGRRPRRAVPLAAGAARSTGRCSKACRSPRRGESRCSWPRARRWAMRANRATPRRPTAPRRSACGSPSTARKTRSIRSPITRSSTRCAPARLGVDEAHHRPHASVAGACRGDRAPDRGRSQIQWRHRPRPAPDRSACAPFPTRSSGSCTCWRAGSSCPNPSGGTLDVTAPLPPHMQASWDLFGFDAKQYDPIDDAPAD